jgi:type II secretory pathway pseudopilin PulG
MYKNSNNKLIGGFSLVELLIYMALMSIFLVVLLDIFTTTLNIKLASESTSALSSDSRYILSKLSYDINNADTIVYPSLGMAGASLQLTTSGSTVSYALGSGNLVKTVDGVSMNLNSIDTELDSISFKNIGSPGGKPTIQIVYTVRSKIVVQGRGTESQTINTTIGTR